MHYACIVWTLYIFLSYRHFFPIFNESGHFEKLRKLETYVGPDIELSKETYGSVLAQTVDRNQMGLYNNKLSKLATSALVKGINRQLNLDVAEEDRGLRLLDAFAVHPDRRFFYLDVMTDYPCPADMNTTIWQICLIQKNLDKRCKDYCDLIAAYREADITQKISEIFAMSVPHAAIEQPKNPIGLLPTCQKGESVSMRHNCWNKIINDRGVCYSSLTSKVEA